MPVGVHREEAGETGRRGGARRGRGADLRPPGRDADRHCEPGHHSEPGHYSAPDHPGEVARLGGAARPGEAAHPGEVDRRAGHREGHHCVREVDEVHHGFADRRGAGLVAVLHIIV